MACIPATSGKQAAAVEALRDALAHRLQARVAARIGEDSDFASLHGDPAFERLAAEARATGTPPCFLSSLADHVP